jgi:N-acyl-D-aspartate/D-glutamate deacylase
MRKMIRLICCCLFLYSMPLPAQTYDIVIAGGRVIDPETGLDAIRNIAIVNGKIGRISAEQIPGARTISAKGLVVAPGFIDLHQHGHDLDTQRLKALDGVTTGLELEIGAPDVAAFLKDMRGHSLINYGTAASHPASRALAFGEALPPERPNTDPSTLVIVPKSGAATDRPATQQQIDAILSRLRSELHAGALAIGMGIQYTPGATRHEVIEIFRVAAESHLPVYTHVRSTGQIEPGSAIEAISEVIGASAISGAPLHIVHINSSCLKDSMECLAMVEGARARGLDVTTEAYPYIAGLTYINSALFNPGFREKLGIDYKDLVIPATGEHLTKARFDELHASSKPQLILIFANTQEMVDKIIPHPLVMIASDGEKSHPRNAGTYSRVLRQYVRERGTLTLMDAIRKMSLMPAQKLERSTPAARNKGRLQEGADADIVIFNPTTITDQSTFEKPKQPSQGMRYVLVAGKIIVDDSKPVPEVFPGEALVGPGTAKFDGARTH